MIIKMDRGRPGEKMLRQRRVDAIYCPSDEIRKMRKLMNKYLIRDESKQHKPA